MKKVFISRDLGADSLFRKELSAPFLLTGMSLIDFEALTFQYPSEAYDWIFFYSKNGVRYFFDQLKAGHSSFPKFAVMGSGTNNALNSFGHRADFIGTGKPKDVATQFLALAKHQGVLFPQAKNSKQSIQKILAEQIESQQLLVYNNSKKRNIPTHLQENDILVFTSPLNAESYLDHFSIGANKTVISIGASTSFFLQKNKISGFIESEAPNEIAIIQAIRALK